MAEFDLTYRRCRAGMLECVWAEILFRCAFWIEAGPFVLCDDNDDYSVTETGRPALLASARDLKTESGW